MRFGWRLGSGKLYSINRRAWGKVNAGVFFKFDLQADQEELCQEYQTHVPMPGGPGTVFVVVQSELGFIFLETPFNGPARSAHSNQFGHRGLFGSVADQIFDLAVGVVAQQQPSFALDRKSTRLNSSHVRISYAVFCLKKKK